MTNTQKPLEQIIQEAQNGTTAERLRSLDLSTEDGRNTIANVSYPRRLDTRLLGNFIQIAKYTQGYPCEQVRISSQNLLSDYKRISNYFGDNLTKRHAYDFDETLTGNGIPKTMLADKGTPDFVAKIGGILAPNQYGLALALSASNLVASQLLNVSPINLFLGNLASDISDGSLSVKTAKNHPHYSGVEKLALKAEALLEKWSEVFYKSFSHYLTGGQVLLPNLELGNVESEEFLSKYLESFKFQRGVSEEIRLDARGIVEGIKTSIDKMLPSSQVETTLRGYDALIDFWQPILERYSTALSYAQSREV